MINELSGNMDGINTGEGVRKDTNKVTEQDVKRVQTSSAQAKKVQDEIKKNKSENNNIAKFLSFLLKSIKNEELMSAIYNTFFKVVDPRTKTSYLRKSTNNILIIGFFAPLYPNEIKVYKLNGYFEEITGNLSSKPGFSEYIYYIKNLSKKYHDQIPINQESMLNFLGLLMIEFGILKEGLNQGTIEKIKKELKKK